MNAPQQQPETPPQAVLAATQPPAGFALATARLVTMDDEAVWHLRHTRADGRNARLSGEHFSAMVTPDGLMKGVTWMARVLADGPLPEKDEAVAMAEHYLGLVAPDLLERMSIKWVRSHEETITVADEDGRHRVTITGMKVKCRNTEDGRYFWVIVGPDNTIVTFERDIVWNTLRASRQTEQWLHDEWLVERSEP